jgi:hypothetical protein
MLFARLAGDARGAALGEALRAVAEGPAALTGNPAGAALAPGLTAGDTLLLWPAGFTGETLFAQWDAGRRGTMGAALFVLWHDALPITTEELPDGSGELAPLLDVEAAWLASSWVGERQAVGAAIRVRHERTGPAQHEALAADVGAIRMLFPELALGAAVRGLGATLRSPATRDPLPLSLDAGVRYAPEEWPVRAYAGAAWRPAGPAAVSLSAEIGEIAGLSARATVEAAGGALGFAAGAGARLDLWQLDYAFAPVGSIGTMHRFTLRLLLSPGRSGP